MILESIVAFQHAIETGNCTPQFGRTTVIIYANREKLAPFHSGCAVYGGGGKDDNEKTR
jgi:hypothetical protein